MWGLVAWGTHHVTRKLEHSALPPDHWGGGRGWRLRYQQSMIWSDQSCLHNWSSIKTKWRGQKSFWVGDHGQGRVTRPQLWDRNSSTQDPLRPHPMYLFICLFICVLYFYFLKMFIFERERVQGRGRVRGEDRGSEAGFALTAEGSTQGLNPWTMRSWPEPKSDA